MPVAGSEINARFVTPEEAAAQVESGELDLEGAGKVENAGAVPAVMWLHGSSSKLKGCAPLC